MAILGTSEAEITPAPLMSADKQATLASAPLPYSATKEAFVVLACELMLAIHEHDAAKADAKAAIIDAYSNGEMTDAQAIDLIREYGLEAS